MAWVFDTHPADSRVVGPVKVAGCVVARYGTGGGNTPMVVDILCRASTQGGAESMMNTATTLTTDHDRTIIAHKNEVVALQGNIIDRDAGMNGSGVGEDVSFTLNTIDRHAVAYDARNNKLGEGVSGTLQAKENGGWSLNYINPVIESSNPENNHAVAYTFGKTSRPHFKGDAPTYRQLDTANTVNTFDTGESRANELAVQGAPPHYIVRRLMPVECGRLQGFPDGWGEIEQLPPDMPEETAAFWRRVYETDCAIKGKRPQKSILEKPDKLAAWHNGLHTDSAEYKMWGNGMALPNALFFVQRAVARVAIDTGKGEANVKLGSMFDGSGTMPLCAAMCGAQPVWASEVEPYPIAVTKTHLPGMKHLGSVTDICGGNIEPVDIITFGSPCQDLSIAGKRAGLDGNRSGLFREAIRIILEMLEATDRKYPRFVIWENVPGALSSNGGKDFETVLNELLRLTGTDQFVRQRGKWGGHAGYGAVAYRLVNAQYWGVPQRRRRVYACCDTGGRSADKILFERKSHGWNFEPCIPAGQTVAGIAGDGYCWHERMVEAKPAGGGYDPAYTMKIRSGCEGGGKGPLVQNDLSATLATHQDQTVFAPRAFSFDSLASNSMKSANPHSGCREVDTAKTLDCGTPNPNRNQGGIAIVQKGSADEQ